MKPESLLNDLPSIDRQRILAKLLKEWRHDARAHYPKEPKDRSDIDKDWAPLEPKWSWLVHLRSESINDSCDRAHLLMILSHLGQLLRAANQRFDEHRAAATFDAAVWLFDNDPFKSEQANEYGLKVNARWTDTDRRKAVLDCLWAVLCSRLLSTSVSFVMSHDLGGHRALHANRRDWERANGQQMRLMGIPTRVSVPMSVPAGELVQDGQEAKALDDRRHQFQEQLASDGERNIYSVEALTSYARDRKSRYSPIPFRHRRAHIQELVRLVDHPNYRIRLHQLSPAHEVCLKLGVEPPHGSRRPAGRTPEPDRHAWVAVRGLASYREGKPGPLGPEYMYSRSEDLAFAYFIEFEHAWDSADLKERTEVKRQLQALL